MTTITGNPVEIWQIPTATEKREIEFLFDNLATEEQARANSLHSDEKKHTYITSHAVMRITLSRFLEEIPQHIDIQINNQGKPVVESIRNIHFNLSHTHSFSLLAITMQNHVGIDIEYIKPNRDFLAIAKRFFNETEYEWLKTLEESELPGYFYQLWCLKEAYLKGTGRGLQGGLGNLSLSLKDMQRVMPFSPSYDPSWHIMPITIPGHYKAALALMNESPIINQRYWNFSEY